MMRKITFPLAIAAGLLPGALRADDLDFDLGEAPPPAKVEPQVFHNEANIETTYQPRNSHRFGRYNGRAYDGATVNGDFSMIWREPWNSSDTQWGSVSGSNLGLTTRSLEAAGGEQGAWRFSAGYDETPYYYSTNSKSLYTTGGETLGFRNNFNIPAAAAQGTSSLTPYLGELDLKTQRQALKAGLQLTPDSNWTVRADVKHEHKEGTKPASLYWGASPAASMATGGGGAVFFGETVDYDTDGVEAKLAYNTPVLQTELGYGLSVFKDNAAFNQLANPFRINNNAGNTAVYALPPSNMAHDLSLNSALRLSDTTRLNLNLAYGQQFQDDAFLGVTTKSGSTASIPKSSLDGRVDTYFANMALTARPLPALDVKAALTYDARDNRTAPMTVNVLTGDYYVAGTNVAVAQRTNPYSFKTQTARLDGSYRLDGKTKASLGYALSQRERTLMEVDRDVEQGVNAKLTRSFGPASGWVSASQSQRTVGRYQSGDAAPYTQHRKFFENDRKRTQFKLGSTVSPAEDWSAGLSAGVNRDEYPNTPSGLQHADGWTGTADLSWNPSKALTSSAYYTYEYKAYDSTSCAANCASAWNSDIDDQIHTLGLTGDWQVVEDLVKVGTDYTLSYATTSTRLHSTSPATQRALQQWGDIRSVMQSLGLHSDVLLRPGTTLRFGYAWERLSARDWAYDGFGSSMAGTPTAITNMLTEGQESNSYNFHLFTIGVKVKW